MEGFGEIWRSRHGTAWSGWVEYGEVSQSGPGVVSFVPARLGNIGQGKAVSVCSGLVGLHGVGHGG